MHFRRPNLFGIYAIFGYAAIAPSLAFSQSTDSCTQTLSAGANVGTAISGAAAGSTICLNDGSYGGFTLNGVTKNPRLTIRAVNKLGASIAGSVNIGSGTNGLTFDGMNFSDITITGAATRELTFKNYNQTSQLRIDGVTNATPNILLDTFSQIGLNVSNANPAGIYLNFTGRATPVVTIRNGTIDGGCADGIQTGVPFILENSRVMNKRVGSCPNDPHTDAVQFYGGPFTGTIVRNNYFYSNVQVLAAYDGVDGVLIENNVFDPGASGERRECQIELYSDAGSIIRHNTVVYRGTGYGHICLDRKSSDNAGFGTVITDNIANSIVALNGSTVAQRSKNLVRTDATSQDISGAPTYVGGATPTEINGFVLAAGSLGKGAASSPSGSDIGANLSSSTPIVRPLVPAEFSVR